MKSLSLPSLVATVALASSILLSPTAHAAPTPSPTPTRPAATPLVSCQEGGRWNIQIGQAGYDEDRDGDKDGVMCEKPGNGVDGNLDTRTCPEVGRTNIPVGDRDYVLSRDRDRDGVACEANGNDGAVAALRPTPSTDPTAKPTNRNLVAPSKDNQGGLARTGH